MVRPVDGGSSAIPTQNNNPAETFAGEIDRAAVRHNPRRDPGSGEGEARLSPAPGYEEGIASGIGENPALSRGHREEDDTPRQGLSEANPPWTQKGDWIFPPDNGIIYK